MKKQIFVYFLIALMPMQLMCQRTNFRELRNFISDSDSIFLVSHSVTQILVKGNKTSKTLRIIENNRINNSLVVEKLAIIKKEDRDELFKILSKPNKDNKIEMASCVLPEHAIIFYRRKKYSYIDISFSCRRIIASPVTLISTFDFSEDKWLQLESFCKRLGITL